MTLGRAIPKAHPAEGVSRAQEELRQQLTVRDTPHNRSLHHLEHYLICLLGSLDDAQEAGQAHLTRPATVIARNDAVESRTIVSNELQYLRTLKSTSYRYGDGRMVMFNGTPPFSISTFTTEHH